MFAKKEKTDSALELEILRVLAEMHNTTPWTEEYSAMAAQLDLMYKLKELDVPDRLSKDALAAAVTSIAGILVIVGHERANVLTSKALTFVGKTFR